LPGTAPATTPLFTTSPGVQNYVFASATYPGGAGSVFVAKTAPTNGSAITLDSGAPLTLAPASGATFSPATIFSWDNRSVGPYTFRALDSMGNVVLTYVTRQNAVRWPADALPSSGAYTWRLSHFHETASVNEMLVERGQSGLRSRVSATPATFTVP